jgi:hypothetical protein
MRSISDGALLEESLRKYKEEIKRLCEGLDDEKASRNPEGRWSPKQIISHLTGPEGESFTAVIRKVLNESVPLVEFEMEDPFFTERRSRMSIRELIAEFDREYSDIADYAATLSNDELGRKAHVPLFKDTDLGEYPTLGQIIQGLADYHMDFHLRHLREVLEALGVKGQVLF